MLPSEGQRSEAGQDGPWGKSVTASALVKTWRSEAQLAPAHLDFLAQTTTGGHRRTVDEESRRELT